ncbi:MAG: peptidoglycan-binding protein [Clostridia bacterium]|nr:peptidoglycan-binding protein [Clostridia bacterium]
MAKLLAVMMLCMLAASPSLAEGSMKLIGIHDFSEYGYLALRTGIFSVNGTGMSSSAEEYRVVVDGYPAVALDSVDGNMVDATGYLFVVDISKPYADRTENAGECMQQVMASLINLMKDKDRVRFLWVGSSVDMSGYMDRVSALAAVTGKECELMTRRRSAKDDDSAVLYDAIGQAVALSINPESEDPCVYHQIVVISDCLNSSSSIGNTTLETVRANIDASGPLPVWCVALRNSSVKTKKAEAADQATIAMQSFVSATGGSFFTMDYSSASMRKTSAQEQAQAISANMASQMDGWKSLVVDLTPCLAMLDRSPAHETEIVLSYGGQVERINRMFAFSLLPTPEPTEAPTPVPTATPNPYFVQVTDKNSDHVCELQKLLADMGYYTGEIDGSFNVATRRAYQMLCDANGLKASTDENNNLVVLKSEWQLIAEDKTLATAVPVTPEPTITPSPTPTPTPAPTYIELHAGDVDTGEIGYVAAMQVRLKELGYYGEDNFTPGVYDDATVSALDRFCRTMGINNTGDGETATLNVQQILHSGNAIRFVTPTPEPQATPTPRPEYMELRAGDVDTGELGYVAALQVRLKELGYYGEDNFTPGVYDGATAHALVRFCQTMGINNTDSGEVATLNIQQILHSNNAIRFATPTPEPEATSTPLPEYIDMSKGDCDDENTNYVANMQLRLKNLGYYEDDEVNLGKYDDATVAALARYCEQTGFSNMGDGSVASVGLQKMLFSADTKAYEKPKVSVRDKTVSWLTDTMSIAGYQIPMWIFVAVGAVAALLIIVLIIAACVRAKGKKQNQKAQATASKSDHTTVKPVVAADIRDDRGGRDERTGAGTDDGRDAPTGSEQGDGDGCSLTLDIEYNGRHTVERYEIMDKLTIGRGSDCDIKLDPRDTNASRRHAELVLADGRLRVRNITERARGTTVNGRKIGETTVYSMAYDLPTGEGDQMASGNEADLESGDVIGISAHRITVKY